jgi:transcriptional regulator CtsR
LSISDIIEQFILESIGDGEYISISRNQLADYFNCVPSQINYVLSTRFTLDRGFITISKRGGGGHIIVKKIPQSKTKYIESLLKSGLIELSEARLLQILKKLEYDDIITERERDIIMSALSDRALLVGGAIKDNVRANILKNILFELLKQQSN